MLDGREPFAYPPPLAVCVRKVLGGEYEYPILPDVPPVRRVLDIGSSVGAFACWIFKRCGRAVFVDCYEPLPPAADICELNLPPGGKVHRVAVTTSPGPVQLHVGADWGLSSLDPKLNPRSGEVVTVPTMHPRDLPQADLIKVDVEGGEIDILAAYPFLGEVGVVMFEWHREADRPQLEALMASAGLRLFKSVHESVDIGLQVWVRSRAVNGRQGRYVMPLPG
jgi:FkbM family methyltransferase